MLSTDSYPDHFECDYRIPVIGNGMIPTGYQPEVLRSLTDRRIKTAIAFDRTADADGSVTTITLGLEEPIAGFENQGREYMLERSTIGLVVMKRAIVEISAIPEDKSDPFNLPDTEILALDPFGNVRISSWLDLIAEGAALALNRGWIMKSSNGEGL